MGIPVVFVTPEPVEGQPSITFMQEFLDLRGLPGMECKMLC